MSDLLRFFLDIVQFLWPFRKVEPWERGVFVVWGRVVEVKPPGIWLIVPYFMDMHTVNTAEARIIVPRQDLTMRDGSTLTISASAQVRVVDAEAAQVRVDAHEETARELLASVIADKIMELDASRLVVGEKRTRTLTDLKRWYNEALAPFGMECLDLSFTNFLLNIKTFRLISGGESLAGIW